MNTAERRERDVRADIAATDARIERLSAERNQFVQSEIDALTEARKNLLKELSELNQGGNMQTTLTTLGEANRRCREAKAKFDGEEEKRRNRGGTADREWNEAWRAFQAAMDEVVRAKGLQPQP